MSLHYLGKHEPGNCVFSVRHRHVSSPGECGWLRACEKARGPHFEHLQLTGSVHSHPHSIAYSLSNISAKNYRNRLMWVESIVCNISVVFLGYSVRYFTVARKYNTEFTSQLIQWSVCVRVSSRSSL